MAMLVWAAGRGSFSSSRLFIAAATTLSFAPKLLFANVCTTSDCSDEVKKAQFAASAADKYGDKYKPEDSIFSKILRKEIPADIVYEDEKVSGDLAVYCN